LSAKSSRKRADGEREPKSLLRSHGYEIDRGANFSRYRHRRYCCPSGQQSEISTSDQRERCTLSFGTVPDLVGLSGIHIECKRVERLNVSEAMRQAVRDSERFRDGFPTVFHRKNREDWLVTMRFEDWMKLYGEKSNPASKLEGSPRGAKNETQKDNRSAAERNA